MDVPEARHRKARKRTFIQFVRVKTECMDAKGSVDVPGRVSGVQGTSDSPITI